VYNPVAAYFVCFRRHNVAFEQHLASRAKFGEPILFHGESTVKQLLFLALMVGMLAPIAIAQSQYEVPGVFSFTYGDGWTKGARKGAAPKELDWLVNTSNHDVNFHADITQSEVSFDNWVTEAAKTVTPDRALTTREPFTTASGVKGYKLAWTVKTASGNSFVRDQYFFRGNHDAKIQLSGMAPASEATTFAPTFDAFAKSLVLQK
jgi:hypothetical protein